jgi:WD40 repeat protein
MTAAPKLIAQSNDIRGESNFPTGASFSPDGLCVLTTTSADSKLRLYNVLADEARKDMEWKAALEADGGSAVRSVAWYPRMNSSEPATCCFLAAAR